ncbi:MAG: sigma-70 family RNA polymerase sigma factor [Planctomycetota bacterium]
MPTTSRDRIEHPELRFSATHPERFEAWVTDYRGLVVGVCRRRLSDPADVEDAAQQTFVKLARSGGDIRGDAGAWLHRTATRTCADLQRSNRRRRQHEARAAASGSRDLRTPVGDVEWSELSAAVDEAMDTLPEAQRAVLTDHFWLGRSQRTMAGRAGVSASTVHARVQAALNTLRRTLQHRGLTLSTGALASGLSAVSVRAAEVPAGLASACTAAGKAALPTAAVPGAALGWGVFLAAPLASTAALVVVGFLTAACATVALRSESVLPMGVSSMAPPDVTELVAVYGLPDETPAGFFPPPFPPERDAVAPTRQRSGPDGVREFTYARMTIHLDTRWGPRLDSAGGSDDPSVEDILTTTFRVQGRLLEGLDTLDWDPGRGDWVIRTRPGMDTQEKLDAFAFVYERQTGTAIRFEPRTYARPHLILASPPDRGPIATTHNVYIGVVTTRPLSPQRHAELVRRLDAGQQNPIGEPDPPLTLHDRPVDRAEDNEWFIPNIVFSSVAEMLDVPVLQPASKRDPTLVYDDGLVNTRFLTPAGEDERLNHADPGYRQRLTRIVEVLQRQLGGDWRIEDRPITVWRPVIEPNPGKKE